MVHVVVSQNKGTPIQPPKYYNPYCGDPQNCTPDFGNPRCRHAAPIAARPQVPAAGRGLGAFEAHRPKFARCRAGP